MLKLEQGEVAAFHPVSRRTVQIQFVGGGPLIELTISDPWVIERGDVIAVAGRIQRRTGKFIAYAYKNHTKGVIGRYNESALAGLVFIIAGIGIIAGTGIGFILILPLVFIPSGVLMIYRKNRALRARSRVVSATP